MEMIQDRLRGFGGRCMGTVIQRVQSVAWRLGILDRLVARQSPRVTVWSHRIHNALALLWIGAASISFHESL